MQLIIDDPNLISLLICSFILFIVLQLYLISKIKTLIRKILHTFIRIDQLLRKIQMEKSTEKISFTQKCQNCRNRMVFLHSKDAPYFYMKCSLNNQTVNPEDFCHQFSLDSQSYEI